jgi:type IV pilus assembly protein PilQ
MSGSGLQAVFLPWQLLSRLPVLCCLLAAGLLLSRPGLAADSGAAAGGAVIADAAAATDGEVGAAVAGVGNGSPYSGEPISMNFQNIDVRAALQILADFNDFSLVVGDSVSGSMTLRLAEVPWDQALDLVLRPQGLGKRLIGTVLYVAPAAELVQAELQELEAQQQVAALEPLLTEYIEIHYARAQDVLLLVQGVSAGAAGQSAPGDGQGVGSADAADAGGRGGLLSARGRAAVDARTNTLIVQDVASVLADIRRLLAQVDVPVRQVLIEARIVNAATSFSKSLGIRWGGLHVLPDSGDRFALTGSLGATGIPAGSSALPPGLPETLAVDLGVELPGASSIAIGYQGDSGLLQLELSALEASGQGEVIAQPKVTTQDKQQARIESGLQIPYQAQAGGTAGGSTTEFVTAALSLDVTPQITPDGRIIMLLEIRQDSVVQGYGAVPAIATNSVNTRVLVNDGDTIVLGGVFREELATTVTKAPLLGDLPYLGQLFRRSESTENKTELLVFITPSIIQELR